MSNRQRGRPSIVIISFVVMIISIISLYATFWWSYFDMQQFSECPVNRWSPKLRNIYQHNGYWVISNFVQNEKWETKNCDTHITYAVQGDYEDIYELEKLYSIGYEEYTSFAVYIPNSDYMIETRIAIAYVRHCLASKSENFKSPRLLIKDYVSFHLYFLYDEDLPFDSLSVNAFEDFIALAERNFTCSAVRNNLYTANGASSTLEKETMRHNNSVTVGKNIAQKEAHTNYILNGDLNYYPSCYISDMLGMEINAIWTNYGGIVNIENFIWRIPVLLTNDLAAYYHYERTNKLTLINSNVNSGYLRQIKGDPFNNTSWLGNLMEDYKIYDFSGNFQKYLNYKTFYIVDADFPLLDESTELTTDQSENLRMYNLKSLDYKYAETIFNYLLHTIDADDGISHNQFDSIDEKIRLEYEFAYDGRLYFFDL